MPKDQMREYVTGDTRSSGEPLKVYLTVGEKKLLTDAANKSMLVPSVSAFMAAAAIERACKILDLPFPLPKNKK